MLNKEFIKRKINLIEEELVHLAEFSQYSFSEIASDYKKQAIIERLLERVIMRAIDINQHLISELSNEDIVIPKDYKETFSGLVGLKIYLKEFADEISKSVGTRNILVHEYDEVDYTKVYSSVKDCLRDYHQYCQYILDFLERK